jgi:hypothetical protein
MKTPLEFIEELASHFEEEEYMKHWAEGEVMYRDPIKQRIYVEGIDATEQRLFKTAKDFLEQYKQEGE